MWAMAGCSYPGQWTRFLLSKLQEAKVQRIKTIREMNLNDFSLNVHETMRLKATKASLIDSLFH